MKLTVTPQAQQWFEKEIDLESGKGIRFYGKVYGKTDVHEGFSVGLSVDTPETPLVEADVDGRHYFVEESDDWFFKGYDLVVDYDEKMDEPKYLFEKNKDFNA